MAKSKVNANKDLKIEKKEPVKAKKASTKKTEKSYVKEKKDSEEPFKQRLAELLENAKKNDDEVTYQLIKDTFKGINLTEDDFDKILEYLTKNGISSDEVEDVDIVVDDAEEPNDEELINEEKEDSESASMDLSIPENISIGDPVKMYLKEIGKVDLLSADQEKELAIQME